MLERKFQINTNETMTITIPHELAYVPKVEAYLKSVSEDEYSTLPVTAINSANGISSVIRARSDAKNVYFDLIYFDLIKSKDYLGENKIIDVKYYLHQ